MIKILIGLLLVYLFLHFIAPVLRIYYEYLRVGMIMKKLNTGGNRLFRNVKIPDYHIHQPAKGPVTAYAPSGNTWLIDYVLQVGDHVFLIRLLSFPRRRVMLRGGLQSKNWS